MGDLIDKAAAIISSMGVKIKEGPYHRPPTGDSNSHHMFRVRTVVSKKEAVALGLNTPKGEDWTRVRSIRFFGRVVDGDISDLQAIGQGERKRSLQRRPGRRSRSKSAGPRVVRRPSKRGSPAVKEEQQQTSTERQ